MDTDIQKLSELKAKAEEFTDATSTLLEDKIKNYHDENENVNTEAEEELMYFFMEKLNEMKQNEINLQSENLKKAKVNGKRASRLFSHRDVVNWQGGIEEIF